MLDRVSPASGGQFLLPLRGAIKHYAWGSRTFLAGFAGATTPSSEPEAELWMGAHPSGPAQVGWNGQWVSLREVIARDPTGLLGNACVERFGAELPFLLKVLAIERPLSLQLHPDREQALAGYERERAAGIAPEQGFYPDPRQKPELIVALEPLWLLRGLLEAGEIRRRFAVAGIASLDAELDGLERGGAAAMRDFMVVLLGVAGAARARLMGEARRAAAAAHHAALSRDSPLYWLARLVELHPEDPAALAPLFLHLIHLAPGYGSFQPPRVLHSYLEGAAVEIMASSDNVVRAGLTTKPTDLAELVAIADLAATPPSPIVPVEAGPGVARYESAAAEFELWRLSPRPGIEVLLADAGAPVLGICTRGEGQVEALERRDETLELAAGGAFAARAGAGRLRLEGDLDLFAASIPAREVSR